MAFRRTVFLRNCCSREIGASKSCTSVNLFRNLIVVLIVYLSLPLLFSVFPSTENYASVLLKWILQPVKSVVIGFVNFLPNLTCTLVLLIWVFNLFSGLSDFPTYLILLVLLDFSPYINVVLFTKLNIVTLKK